MASPIFQIKAAPVSAPPYSFLSVCSVGGTKMQVRKKSNAKTRRIFRSDKDDKRDARLALLKGGIGVATAIAGLVAPAVPFIAPILQEAIGARIPDYRRQRVENLLLALTANINNLDATWVAQRFQSPEFNGLLEEGCLQAQKAISDERIRYIASLLTKCLSDEELDHITAQRMMAVLSELNDVEVLFLITERQRPHKVKEDGIDEFWEKTGGYFPPFIDCDSSPTAFKRRTVLQSYEKHLLHLGLLNEDFRGVMSLNCPFPEFNITKLGLEVTILGNVLLDYIHPESSEKNR